MSDRKERRFSGRFNLWFYLDFYREAGDRKCGGICYDISTTGMMIGTSEKLVVGEHLHLSFRIMPEHANDARVFASPIRVLENPYDTTGTWPHLCAIQFDEAFPELEPLLQIAAQSDKVKR